MSTWLNLTKVYNENVISSHQWNKFWHNSELDTNSGFWQIELAAESKLLNTFITPYGCFCFNRFPFGITSIPEHSQQRMSEMLHGFNGVAWLVDDIPIYGSTQAEHDGSCSACIKQAGLTLSKKNANSINLKSNLDNYFITQEYILILIRYVLSETWKHQPISVSNANFRHDQSVEKIFTFSCWPVTK